MALVDEIVKLEGLARAHGLRVVQRAHGHIQVQGGPMLVNWWPTSKRRSAYVDGTKGSISHASAEKVIDMALNAPPRVKEKVKRRGKNTRKRRLALLRKDPHCHWCRCALTLETSTLDHVIPLARGGLDHHNNVVIACEPCNTSRGHDMPEVRDQGKPVEVASA